jgi:spermidine/putrescine transport system substrate-binding protein
MRRYWMGMMVLLVGFALAACSAQERDPVPAPAAAGQTDSGHCGDRSRLSDNVNLYIWTEYIDPEVLIRFEEECGVKVTVDTYSSNEDLLAKIQGGATGYDLIVPSDYMVTIMVNLGLLREVDHANIPNLVNLDERFQDVPYDPDNRYSVAYQWGTAGIGYDAAVVTNPPTSLAAIFDPAQAQRYAGQISLLNDGREVLGAALKYLGYSMNSTEPAQLEEAKQVILAIKPYVLAFDNDAYPDLLTSGETVIGHGWNGGFYQAIFDNDDRQLRFVVPEEGLTLFTDNLAIPASAPNPYTAEVLINYLLDPEIGALISNFTLYATPNAAALPFVEEDLRTDPGIYPPQDTLDRMEFIIDVGEATALYERIWTEIKAD